MEESATQQRDGVTLLCGLCHEGAPGLVVPRMKNPSLAFRFGVLLSAAIFQFCHIRSLSDFQEKTCQHAWLVINDVG